MRNFTRFRGTLIVRTRQWCSVGGGCFTSQLAAIHTDSIPSRLLKAVDIVFSPYPAQPCPEALRTRPLVRSI